MRALSGLCVALVLVAGASAAGGARVRLVSVSPAVISGAGFVGRERVTVTASGPTNSFTQTVRASVQGAFVARFAGSLSGGNCTPFTIRAQGSHGDRAVWRSPPVMCGAQP